VAHSKVNGFRFSTQNHSIFATVSIIDGQRMREREGGEGGGGGREGEREGGYFRLIKLSFLQLKIVDFSSSTKFAC